MSCYLHHVPGRIRIKIPGIKGNPIHARELEEKLKVIPGVRLVSVNSLTGSVLAYYDERGTNAGVIADVVSRETGVDLSTAAHPDDYSDEAWSRTGQAIGEKIGKAALGIVIGQIFEGSPLALLAAVI
ncbi:MAG: HMA2 domain-containing protein [Syntrophobacteraceae bacterium]